MLRRFHQPKSKRTCHVIHTFHIFDKLEAWLKTCGFVVALVVSSVMYGKIYQTIRHQAKIHAQLVGGASKKAVSPRTAFQLGEGLKQPVIDVSHAYDSGLAQSLNVARKPSDRQEATAIARCPQGPRTSYLQVHRSAIERDLTTHNSVSSAFDNYRSASQLTLTNSQANAVPIRSRQNSRPKVSDRGENRTTKMLMAVTAILLASWLPPIVFFHLRDSTLDIIKHSVTAETLVYIGRHLPSINHIVTYFVYTFMNKRFRVDCKRLFKTRH